MLIHLSPSKKRRAGRACNLCRVKKTRCDSRKPCLRCVSDNKLCIYLESKKERAHLPRDIEILEARLELLTRALEKIVLLAEPHLPFIRAMIDKTEPKRYYVPVNDVVGYLVSDFSLANIEKGDVEKSAMETGFTSFLSTKTTCHKIKRRKVHENKEELYQLKSHDTGFHPEAHSSAQNASGNAQPDDHYPHLEPETCGHPPAIQSSERARLEPNFPMFLFMAPASDYWS